MPVHSKRYCLYWSHNCHFMKTTLWNFSNHRPQLNLPLFTLFIVFCHFRSEMLCCCNMTNRWKENQPSSCFASACCWNKINRTIAISIIKLAGSPSTWKKEKVEFYYYRVKTHEGLLVPRCNGGSSEPEEDTGADLKFEFEFKKKPQSIDRTKHHDHASARSREMHWKGIV